MKSVVPMDGDAARGRTTDFAWICALYELGQRAANGADPQGVRQEILEHIVRGFDAQSGSIALIVEGTEDELELAAGTDLPPGLIGSALPRGTGVFGHVVATGQPVLVNGDAAHTGLPLLRNELRERATHSAMCWPLSVAGTTIGAVAVNRAQDQPRYTVADLDGGQALTSLLALVMANHRMHVERENRIHELSTLNATMQRMNSLLEDAQNQVIQSDKLASIGQIAAGVAHEINNPVGYVLSNVGTLESYVASLFDLVDAYVDVEERTPPPLPGYFARVRELRGQTDVPFLREDIRSLLSESRDGLLRVKRIVQDLKDFSRGGAAESWERVDLHAALDSTLNIVRNELKHKVRIERRYGVVPEIECLPSRLNQVFLNLLVNAGQAIDGQGTVTLTTACNAEEAWVVVEDTGGGIAPEHRKRIFEPFFTTKPVGQGTGLGLSVSYSIVRKHGGRIEVESAPGKGTRFTVFLPLSQTQQSKVAAAVAG
ncbi:MAG: ATP-binding protein [Casimicrobiaceae bacterium]